MIFNENKNGALNLISPELRKKVPVIFIVGPTASGKSQAALRLAKKINGEIISCDSMQVYKKMPVITCQPPEELRRRVPHHLIAELSPAGEWNAAEFARRAKKELARIKERGRIPVIAGGSGLYVRALVEGIFKGPGKSGILRKKLAREAKKCGAETLYTRLKNLDPPAADGIHPNDLRRIIRALEVYELSRQPFSRLRETTSGIAAEYPVHIFGLHLRRQEIYSRINKRVEEIFESGAVGEVKALLGMRISKTAAAALGIKEIKGFLEGEYSLARAKELVRRNTRHFAKRQITWFRADKRVIWLDASGGRTDVAVKNILAELKKRGFSFDGTRLIGND